MALNLKSLLFVSLFIALVAAPIAEATVFTRLVQILGSVFCTPDGNMLGNGTATPPFPNAQVQLRCGAGNVTVLSAVTNGAGVFSNIGVLPLNLNPSLLPINCNLVVTTPLSSCNSTLPSVGLRSPVRINATIVLGPLNLITITVVVPVRFQPIV